MIKVAHGSLIVNTFIIFLLSQIFYHKIKRVNNHSLQKHLNLNISSFTPLRITFINIQESSLSFLLLNQQNLHQYYDKNSLLLLLFQNNIFQMNILDYTILYIFLYVLKTQQLIFR